VLLEDYLEILPNKMKVLLLLFMGCFFKLGSSKGISDETGAACLFVASNFSNYPFDCAQPDLEYKCRCLSPEFLGTVLLCIDDNTDEIDELTRAFDYIKEVCGVQGSKKYSFTQLIDVFDNATSHAIPVSVVNGLNKSQLHNPVIPDAQRFASSQESVRRLLNHRYKSTKYGVGLIGYWGLSLILATTNNVLQWCFPYIYMNMNGDTTRWLREHVICPQLISESHFRKNSRINTFVNSLLRSFPIRVQSITVAFYMALVTIFCTVDYQLYRPNSIFPWKNAQLFAYIADRTGILAITQLPMLILFSGRNNVLQLITGWPYRTFNIFHRWIARTVWILVLLHAVFYVAFTASCSNYRERWMINKWRWANTAFVAASISIFLSSRYFRRKCHQLFVSSHQILAIIFVLGCWYHCLTLGWMEFLYITVAIWALEYFSRFGKIMLSGGIVQGKCTLVLNKKLEPHSLRITVHHSGWWRSFPGAYSYLYFLKPKFFWQSHPFTILGPARQEDFNKLVFLIRIKNGITKKLGNYIMRQENLMCTLPMLVEGPYGSTIPFKAYQHSIFFAGGVGITVVYTFAMDLAHTYLADKAKNHSINVIWSAPTISAIEEFVDEIEALSRFEMVKVIIYLTRELEAILPIDDQELKIAPKEMGDPIELVNSCTDLSNNELVHLLDPLSTGSKELPTELNQRMNEIISTTEERVSPVEYDATREKLQNVFFRCKVNLGRRPSIKKELPGLLKLIPDTTAVVSCGPDKMNRDVRNAVAKSLREPNKGRIDYFEEELVW